MFVEAASNHAAGVDFLMDLINIITIICLVLVNGVMIYFIIRYRRRGPNDKTSKIAHSTTIEVIWTVVPTIVFFALFYIGIKSFFELRAASADALELRVTASQWKWDMYYPASLRQDQTKRREIKTTNLLILEEGKPVKIIMTSRDVLHSFYIPAFRLKEDVVPGMNTYIAFTPMISREQASRGRAEYNIFCAEFCGNDHSAMLGKVLVLKSDAYRAELARVESEAGGVSVEDGKKIYENNCRSCHSIDGTKIVGPSFKGVFGKEESFADGSTHTVDENYIRESLANPGAKIVAGFPPAMPVQDLGEEGTESIILFLKSLK